MSTKSISANLYQYPNEVFESEDNFQGEPSPTKIALKTLGHETIMQIDAQLKESNEDRKLKCGSDASLSGIASSQVFRDNNKNVDIYCFNGLILEEEHYVYPEKMVYGNYTVMMTSEFIKKEINQVFEMHSIRLEAERRDARLESMKKERENRK